MLQLLQSCYSGAEIKTNPLQVLQNILKKRDEQRQKEFAMRQIDSDNFVVTKRDGSEFQITARKNEEGITIFEGLPEQLQQIVAQKVAEQKQESPLNML